MSSSAAARGTAADYRQQPAAASPPDATVPTPDHQVLRDLIALESQLTALKRVTGRRLTFAESLGRLLAFRTAAVEAELHGRYRRADFLWDRLQEQFAAASTRDADWRHLADQANARAASPQLQGDQLRRAFAQQVMLETQWAFYRGARAQTGPAQARCPVHLRYLRQILSLPAFAGGENLAAFQSQCKQDIAACIEAKQWKQARELSAELLSLLTDDQESQDLASAAWFLGTLDGLKNGDTESDYLRDAETLKDAIGQLEIQRARAPYNLLLLQRIARLHFLRAVRLGNAQRLSEALLAVEKAVTFQPTLKDAWDVRKQLIEMMETLRKRVKDLLAQVAATPNAQLNAHGRQMERDANTGFNLLNAYADSAQAKRQSQDYRMAQALSIWKEMSLGQLAADDERPLQLLAALEEIFQAPPPAAASLAAAWGNAAASNEHLRLLDSRPVVAFLHSRLFPDDTPQPAPEADPKPAQPALAAGPLLVPGPPRRWFDWEPFGYWLFSGQARFVKAELAAAVVLLLVAGSLALREWSNRSFRSAAYARMSQAAAVQDDLAAIGQAEAFLSRGVLAPDPRDEEVRSAYAEALLRWVASQNPPADIAGNHLQRYRTLVGDRVAGETPK